MVVDDVEHDGEAGAVRGVDQPLEPERAAVGGVRGGQVDAVIAPAVAAGVSAIGGSSIVVTPRSRSAARCGIAASNVPSCVNVPTSSS